MLQTTKVNIEIRWNMDLVLDSNLPLKEAMANLLMIVNVHTIENRSISSMH